MQPKRKNSEGFRDIAKYSNIAIKMFIIIGGSVAFGVYADSYLGLRFPIMTLVLSFGSVCLAIYVTIRDLIKK